MPSVEDTGLPAKRQACGCLKFLRKMILVVLQAGKAVHNNYMQNQEGGLWL